MTRPVNIYMLSRISGEEAFNNVYHHAAEKHSRSRTQFHEMTSLRIFVDEMVRSGLNIEDFDGFFFSFSIPQIGKEFDLLKIGEEALLNVELKSQEVPLQQIRSQLMKNRHYLTHLGRKMSLFTIITDTRQCFGLDDKGTLQRLDIPAFAEAVRGFSKGYTEEIDGLFRASEYLVSPVRTPEKFLSDEYFLTQAQDQIKRDLLAAIEDTAGTAFFSLQGKPGTGKTLLLYDVGKELGKRAATALVHWGPLQEGHRVINDAGCGLTIISSDELEGKTGPAAGENDAGKGEQGPADLLAPYSYVLVDESHRISPDLFSYLCACAGRFRQNCVFCLDPERILTTAQRRNDIAGRIEALSPRGSFVLSERLRGNSELRAFIREVQDLANKPKIHMDYKDVDLNYAETTAQAQNMLDWYRGRGYIFINYAQSRYAESPYAQYEGDYDTEHIAGQEFDRVVMLMDSSFFYTEEGRLEGVPHPDPDLLYPNLFYQGITRVREKLALIVVDNPELFDRISGIVKE